ncbi:MAG: JAB domain-containing protein [Chthoniobacterales bacterium]
MFFCYLRPFPQAVIVSENTVCETTRIQALFPALPPQTRTPHSTITLVGDPRPSDADLRVTRIISEAGRLMQIQMLDHIITGAPASGQPGYSSSKGSGDAFHESGTGPRAAAPLPQPRLKAAG